MFRFSVRELLAVFLILGVALAALRIGGLLAMLLQLLGFIFLLAVIINALVGQGNRRVFSIGFLMPCLVYTAILLASGSRELAPYNGEVPTSQLLGYLHQAIVGEAYYDMQGNLVKDYDPAVHDLVAMGSGGLGGGMFGSATYPKNAVALVESTDRATYMTIGHGLIAMLCGWIGGKYAVHVAQKSE